MSTTPPCQATFARPCDTPSISGALALLFAIACGLAVANVYYAQPLLDTLAHTFGIRPATVGVVITITQIGYGLGLLLVFMPASAFILTRYEDEKLERQVRWGILVIAGLLLAIWVRS